MDTCSVDIFRECLGSGLVSQYYSLLYRHEYFTGKYTTSKIHRELYPGNKWLIFRILAIDISLFGCHSGIMQNLLIVTGDTPTVLYQISAYQHCDHDINVIINQIFLLVCDWLK